MFSESMLGVELGLAYSDVSNCLPENESSPYEKKFKVLYLWKRQKGQNATNRALIEGIARCGLDTKLYEHISEVILQDQGADSHDVPVASIHPSLFNQGHLNLLMIFNTVVACHLHMFHLLMSDRERREEETALLRIETARLVERCSVVERERDNLSLEVERLQCLITSKAGAVPEPGSGCCIKEEHLGDKTVLGESDSFSSSESSSQPDLGVSSVATSQAGVPFTADPSFGFSNNTEPFAIGETVLPIENTLPSQPVCFNLQSQVDVSCEDESVEVNLEPDHEALTPDIHDQMNDSLDKNDSSKFSSPHTSSPKPNSPSQPESYLASQLPNSPIESVIVIHAGTRREHPQLLNEEAQMDWPSPKYKKVASP